MNNLDKLNRLRVNAGKQPLKSFKAGQKKLDAVIQELEKAGFTDTVPGADTSAAPVTSDPEIVKSMKPLEDEDIPSLADSALSKTVAKEPKKEPEAKKQPAKLARGLETEKYAVHSRKAVADHRSKEKKAAKLSKEDKKQIKDEAKHRNIAGKVDEKKDPEKAARQKKHVEDKQKARAGKPKKETSSDEITVAEIARELDIDPKVARAKLRRHEAKISSLHTKGQDRWTFPKSAKPKIVEILK